NGQVYNEFLNIMAEFRINQIGHKQLLVRAAMLFEGHPSLINQFIQFLPQGHTLTASET
ncbi:hypothetical protein K501DRAFT_288040, partial [Backusella circina FSU 941]